MGFTCELTHWCSNNGCSTVYISSSGSSTRIHTVAHAQNTFSMAQQVVNEVNKEQLLREDEEKCQWFIISCIR